MKRPNIIDLHSQDTGRCIQPYGFAVETTALAHKGGRLNDPSHHLANDLKGQGYATALSGTQHVTQGTVEGVQALGYDRFLTRERWPIPRNAPEQPR